MQNKPHCSAIIRTKTTKCGAGRLSLGACWTSPPNLRARRLFPTLTMTATPSGAASSGTMADIATRGVSAFSPPIRITQ